MAEEQDITQVDQTSLDIPSSDLVASSTTEEQKPIPTPKPDPTFRKKIWNGLVDLNKQGIITLKLKSEQEFYTKLDADQEYARQLYSNLKKILPADNLDQDESVFLSKVYGKATKPFNSGMAASEPMTTTNNKPAKVETVSTDASEEALNTPAQVAIAKKELEDNNKQPTPYKLPNGKTVIFKYNSKGNITASYATQGEKATDKFFQLSNDEKLKKESQSAFYNFDQVYEEHQKDQDVLRKDQEALDSRGSSFGGMELQAPNKLSSINRIKYNNRLEIYDLKIKQINKQFDEIIKLGINEKNYKRFLSTDNNGFSVVSQSKIDSLASQILTHYGGNASGKLKEMLVGRLESYLNAFPGMLEASKNTDKRLKSKFEAAAVEKASLLNKAQDEKLLTQEEIKNTSNLYSNEAKVKGTELSKPYLDQIKTLSDQQQLLNDNLEAESKKFFSTLTETDADIKPLYEKYLAKAKGLENSQYNNQERDTLNKKFYDDFVKEASPFFEARQKEFNDKYKTTFDQISVQINDIAKEMNGKLADLSRSYNDKFRLYQDQRVAQGNKKIADIQKQFEAMGISKELSDEYTRVWKEEFDKYQSKRTSEIYTRNELDNFGPLGLFTEFGKSVWNNFGGGLENMGTVLNFDALKILGAEMNRGEYGFSIPDISLKNWKDLANPYKIAGSTGQLVGRILPQAAVQIPLAYATGGMSFLARASFQMVAGYALETVDMAGGKYNEVLMKTGDPAKANKAAQDLAFLNLRLLPTYGLEVLPFFSEFRNIVKGKSLLSYLGRAGMAGGTEMLTETFLQEFPQNAMERKVELDAVYNANVSLTDILFTNGKALTDKSGKVLIDQEYQRTIKTDASGDLKNTFLNVGPASFLMAALPVSASYGKNKYQELVGKRIFAKYKLGLVNSNLAKQKLFEILLTRGENTAGAFLTAMQTSGVVSEQEFNDMLSSLEEMQSLAGLSKREKLSKEDTMLLGALMFEFKTQEKALANPELTAEEKSLIEERLKYSKDNFNNFLRGKKSDFVIFRIGNTDHIVSYDQLDRLMNDQEFVNSTKGSFSIFVAGSQVNSKGENLKEKAMRVFEVQPLTQEQIDEMERNGTPVMDIFANTEIPNLNSLVQDLEDRMNNAEEIDEKDMNSAIAGLYEQLQNILDNHYNTENGKRAAQMLMETIEKFEDYEFTTKEETVDVEQRTTTQGIREVVNATKNIFGRITGTAKSGAKKFARITTGFKQQGKYSIEINEKDEVVMTPMSGAPIVLGSRKDLNGKVKFVSSSFSGKTGKISTITFRVNEANENGVMPEVTLSTADGFSYDELLDMAIDLRAMEIGEVTTEEFDNAVEEVTSGKKTVKTFPNIGKAEQKAKAKAEAAAQQQATPEQAPQQTPEQINQRVQELQAQQAEELKAAQDMIKTSNIRSSGMSLTEAIKARDEKVKQIKSKYKVLIDNAKKGIIEETQQAEEEQQQEQAPQQDNKQKNKDVVDINSSNIEDLQNIPTENKFQQRVLTAIPNILKALSKFIPGIKVSIHLTSISYYNKVQEDSNGKETGFGTKGYYFNKTINIDLSKINSIDGLITAFHESFHGMYKLLPEGMKKMLYESIQTIIIRDGFRFKVNTKAYFDRFAREYKSAERQEEAVVEFLGHMASGGVTLTVPGYKLFIDVLNKILDKINMGAFKITTSKQARDFAKGVVNALKTGQDITELVPEAEQNKNGLTQQQEIAFRSAVSIMKKLEKFTKYGLDEKRNKTRKVAEALEKRQREITGIIDRDDRSLEAMKKISSWMAEEVRYSLQTEKENSGKGWYGEFFQKGLDEMGDVFPELKTDKNARDLFTMLVAVTSDGEKVFSNFRLAAKAYAYYRENGKMPDSIGGNRINIDEKVILIGSLLNQYNNDIPGLVKMLTTITTITEINKKRKKQGLEELSSDWPVAFKIPAAAAYFGPKLGMFYANLMGNEKYPTLDRWWSRSFNRYRGTLLPVLKRFEQRKDGTLVKIGIELFKEKILGDPNATDEQAIGVAIELRNSYEAKGYKNPTDGEESANTIYKILFENINDAPFNGGDRMFMYDTIVMAQKKLKNTGQNLSIADIQAILWYFEKRLYKELGVRGKIEGVSYQEAAKSIIEKFNEFGTWDFPEKKKSDKKGKKGKSDEDSLNDGAEKENNEEGDISFRNEDVTKLFKSNPDLAKIGTQKQYNQYLDTIFPDSQVKDIVYHGAMEQLLPKDGKFKGYVTYFSTTKKYSETFGFPINRKIIQAVVNIVNPYKAPSELADVPEEIHNTDEFTNPRIIKSNKLGYDSVIGVDAGQKEGSTVAVFEPEQIHILGNKQDLEGFKKFVETTPQTEDISFRNETAKLFEQANNLKEMTQEAENTAEKRKFANERREMLAENPSVKLIDDNFKNIIDQLKQNEEFEFKGPCF